MKNLYLKYHGLPGVGVNGNKGNQGEKGQSIYFGYINDFFDGVTINLDTVVKVASRILEDPTNTKYNLYITALANKAWNMYGSQDFDSSFKDTYVNYLIDIVKNKLYFTGTFLTQEDITLLGLDDSDKVMLTIDTPENIIRIAQIISTNSNEDNSDIYNKHVNRPITSISIDNGGLSILEYYNLYNYEIYDANYRIDETGNVYTKSPDWDGKVFTYESNDAAYLMKFAEDYKNHIYNSSIFNKEDNSDVYYVKDAFQVIDKNFYYAQDANSHFADVDLQNGTLDVSLLGDDYEFYHGEKDGNNILSYYKLSMPLKKNDNTYSHDYKDNTYIGLDSSVIYKDLHTVNDIESIIENLDSDFVEQNYENLSNYVATLTVYSQDPEGYDRIVKPENIKVHWTTDENEAALFVPTTLKEEYNTGDTLYFYTDTDNWAATKEIKYMSVLTENLKKCSPDTLISSSQIIEPFNIKYIYENNNRLQFKNNVAVLLNDNNDDLNNFSNKSFINIIDKETTASLIIANVNNDELYLQLNTKDSSLLMNSSIDNMIIKSNRLKIDNLYINSNASTNAEVKNVVYDSNIILNNGFIKSFDSIDIKEENNIVYYGNILKASDYFINCENIQNNYYYGYDLYDNDYKLISSEITDEQTLSLYIDSTDTINKIFYIIIYAFNKNGNKVNSKISKLKINNDDTATITVLNEDIDITQKIIGNINFDINNITSEKYNGKLTISSSNNIFLYNVLFNHEETVDASNDWFEIHIDSSNNTNQYKEFFIDLSTNLPVINDMEFDNISEFIINGAELGNEYESNLFVQLKDNKKQSTDKRSILVTAGYFDINDADEIVNVSINDLDIRENFIEQYEHCKVAASIEDLNNDCYLEDCIIYRNANDTGHVVIKFNSNLISNVYKREIMHINDYAVLYINVNTYNANKNVYYLTLNSYRILQDSYVTMPDNAISNAAIPDYGTGKFITYKKTNNIKTYKGNDYIIWESIDTDIESKYIVTLKDGKILTINDFYTFGYTADNVEYILGENPNNVLENEHYKLFDNVAGNEWYDITTIDLENISYVNDNYYKAEDYILSYKVNKNNVYYENYTITQPGFNDTRDIPTIELNMHNNMIDMQHYNDSNNGVLCNQVKTYMDINVLDFNEKWGQFVDASTEIYMNLHIKNLDADLNWLKKYIVKDRIAKRATIKLLTDSEKIITSEDTDYQSINNYILMNNSIVKCDNNLLYSLSENNDSFDVSTDIIVNDDYIVDTSSDIVIAYNYKLNNTNTLDNSKDVSILINDDKVYLPINESMVEYNADPQKIYAGLYYNNEIIINNIKITDVINDLHLKIELELGNPIISNLYLRYFVNKVDIVVIKDGIQTVFTASLPDNMVAEETQYYLGYVNNEYESYYKYISEPLDIVINPLSYTVCPTENEKDITNIQGNIYKTGSQKQISNVLKFYGSSLYENTVITNLEDKDIRSNNLYDWSVMKMKKSYLQDNIKDIIAYPINFNDIINKVSNNNLLKIYESDKENSLLKNNNLDIINGEKYLSIVYNAVIMNCKKRNDISTFFYNSGEYEQSRYNQYLNNYPIFANDEISLNVREQDLIDSMDKWNDVYLQAEKLSSDITFTGVLSLYGNGYTQLVNNDPDLFRGWKFLYTLDETKEFNNEYIYNSSIYDEVSLNPDNMYEPNDKGYFRSFLYDINWEYPHYINDKQVIPYQLVSSFDYLLYYMKLNNLEIPQEYEVVINKLVDKNENMIPYNLLYTLYPRIAYNFENKSINVLMLRRPSIENDNDKLTNFEECYNLNKHYFEVIGDLKKLIIPYSVK